MANDATEVVVGTNGKIWVGPTDAAAPDDVATAMDTVDAEWLELGYISEEGAKFSEGKTVADINAWQSFYPIRRIITGRSVTLAFSLRQWNKDTVEFALGGTVADNNGEYTYTPPTPDQLDNRSVTLEWFDGDKSYRLYMPAGIVSENVEISLMRTAAADLPITFAATDPGVDGNGDPISIYTLFTDDPAFASS